MDRVKLFRSFKETEKKWTDNSSEDPHLSYKDVFLEISYKALLCLIDNLFSKVGQHFSELFDESWLTNVESNPVGEICNSFNETFEIFDKLNSESYSRLWNIVRRRSIVHYLTAMMKRKISLATPEDRSAGVAKIREDESLFNEFFAAMETEELQIDSEISFDVLNHVSNVVAADEEMLTFELMTLIRKAVQLISNENLLYSIMIDHHHT